MAAQMEALSSLPQMPDVAHSHYGFHHNVHSALETLSGLGISSRRVTVRMAGLGYPSGWVTGQQPEAGAVLTPDAIIVLRVAGLGLFHHLPVAMWDTGGEAAVGTREIVELFDDPFQKAAHWIWEGARVYDIHPGNLPACARWITLFGIEPADWPEENWYQLALVLPQLHAVAGREEGLRMALHHLLDLDLLEIRFHPAFSYLPAEKLSQLGRKSSQLGIDAIVGDRVEDLRSSEVRIGPVTLRRYYEFQQKPNRRRLEAVLKFCLPFHQSFKHSFEVLDRHRPPRLGSEEENARLGINSHMGPANGAALENHDHVRR
jgi:hypothetical protein